ncbi:MAG: DUF2062 domain-containing protein [Pseudomonadota bacterium]
MRRWLKKRLPNAETLAGNRWLRPMAPVLRHPNLWHLNRRTVAGGVAVGLFFGLLIPVAQILLAAVVAVWLRVNLPVATVSTLITNPFTFPPIYFAAYRLGGWLTGTTSGRAPDGLAQGAQAAVESSTGWLDLFMGFGQPLVLGLAVLAVAGSALGYLLVSMAWRGATLLQRSRNRRRRRSSTATET